MLNTLNVQSSTTGIIRSKAEIKISYHFPSSFGFVAPTVVVTGFLLDRLLSRHYIKYSWKLIDHIKKPLPAHRTNIQPV
jgi:hypothetical protein